MFKYLHEPSEVYFKSKGLSKSAIDDLLQCPALYKAKRDGSITEDSKAFRVGSLLHSMVLEPETVDTTYKRLEFSGTTKAGKEERADIAAKGLVPITTEEWETATQMATKVMQQPAARALLKLRGDSELSCYWETQVGENRLQCKGRVDRLAYLPNGQVVAIDLKTTGCSGDPEEIRRKAADFGYHRQAAWYRDGLTKLGFNVQAFLFIFVSKQEPHFVTPIVLSPRAEEIGLRQCMRGASIFIDCKMNDSWPCFTNKIMEIDLPGYYYKKEQLNDDDKF